MPRCRTWGCRHHGHLRGQQLSGDRVEAPDQREIESRIIGDDKLPARIGGHHVQMRTVVVAGRKLTRRIIRLARMMTRAYARADIRRLAQRSVGSDREDGRIAAAVIRGEHELSGRMHAEVRRRRTA